LDKTVTTYERIAELSLEIERFALEGLEHSIGPEFTRRTTVIRLAGEGHEGVGEDVTYSEEDQLAFQSEGRELPLSGSFTLASFSELLARLSLFPSGPAMDAFHNYRRWALESAALDLALRQAGRSLADVLERPPRPVRFVVSLRLPEPPTIEPLRRRLALYPGLRLKLDPQSTWDDDLVAELATLDAVDVADLKGAYEGTPVDQPPDPLLYERVATALPDALLEDPALTPETEPVLARYRERVSWDAPIHSIADIEALPFSPRTLNMKPSRFGALRTLFDTYDYLGEHGISAYGGGQFELGPGRGQIQYLAALFHPDGPNDVAPVGFHEAEPRSGLPTSPLPPRPDALGFRWAAG
jgi:hypothetical protein